MSSTPMNRIAQQHLAATGFVSIGAAAAYPVYAYALFTFTET